METRNRGTDKILTNLHIAYLYIVASRPIMIFSVLVSKFMSSIENNEREVLAYASNILT